MEFSPDPTTVWFKENSSKHCMEFYQNNDSYSSIRYLLDVISKGQISPVPCLSEIYSQGSKTDI